MIKKIKLALLSLSTLMAFAIPLALGGVASADIAQSDFNNNLCSGSNGNLVGTSTTNCDNSAAGKANTLISDVVNIISVVVGVIAVIMIIVAGFRYVASGGKQESVSGAKNTILYAIIGLVIVALAQLIVHFVLNKTSSATG